MSNSVSEYVAVSAYAFSPYALHDDQPAIIARTKFASPSCVKHGIASPVSSSHSMSSMSIAPPPLVGCIAVIMPSVLRRSELCLCDAASANPVHWPPLKL